MCVKYVKVLIMEMVGVLPHCMYELILFYFFVKVEMSDFVICLVVHFVTAREHVWTIVIRIVYLFKILFKFLLK